uniref:Olfactory receptor n=1 Tax=Cynoglossus semilaevis TaxID=244447 RepID=A0A3P8V262_CYNSE
METLNSSQVVYSKACYTGTRFNSGLFSSYLPFGHLNYLYFTILAMIYTSIVVSNTCVIVVICMNRSLHEPMYLFLCSLFVNELYGSTALFPFLLIQVLSDVHTVPRSLCFLQVFCIHTYGNIEICNLAVMSYDRYVAICCPLQYNRRMTTLRALVFITVVWLDSFIKFLIPMSLNLRLTLCGNVINSVCCSNYAIVKLACSDTTVNNIYGLFGTVLSVVLPLFPMLFSYLRIFKVSGSKQTRQQKALSTCSPHLASLINFSCGAFCEVVQSRYDMSNIPNFLRVILSLYFLACQPLFNPVMYGLNLRQVCKLT